MSKPLIHAKSSAKQYGGQWQDYIEIHEFLDSSKSAVATNAHRALTHNSWFISTVIPRVFGEVFKRKSDGAEISSRDIAEQHVAEDYANRFIPSAQDFLQHMSYEPWMQNGKGTPPSFAKIFDKDKPETPDKDPIELFLETAHTGFPAAALDGSLSRRERHPLTID